MSEPKFKKGEMVKITTIGKRAIIVENPDFDKDTSGIEDFNHKQGYSYPCKLGTNIEYFWEYELEKIN